MASGKTEDYNGWPNRETWAVHLHQTNHREIRREVDELIKLNRFEPWNLVESLKDLWTKEIERAWSSPHARARQAVREVGSFWRVNWRHMADLYCWEVNNEWDEPFAVKVTVRFFIRPDGVDLNYKDYYFLVSPPKKANEIAAEISKQVALDSFTLQPFDATEDTMLQLDWGGVKLEIKILQDDEENERFYVMSDTPEEHDRRLALWKLHDKLKFYAKLKEKN